ncbi:MAG TPA: AtpZ/AtpI family protein [Longimicrobium sp.]|nr:AtpZ/AtpI family protein [Longimicrobium sp.]
MAQTSDPRRPNRQPIPDAGQYASVGLQFGLGILVFTFAGRWLDGRLGTSPWLLLAGVMLGFGLSAAWIYRQLVIRPRERARREEDRP